jgi:putative transcriptional regulator
MPSPSTDVIELLPLYAAGVLDDAEAAEIERALGEHPALRRELDRWRDAFASVGEAAGEVQPDDSVRARLLASTSTPGAAVAHFAPQVADLYDLPIDAARTLLARVDDAAAWRPLMPGIDCLKVDPGARHAGVQCNLVRIAPGTTFPWHRHLGEEVSLILHGGAHMSDGYDLLPGDTLVVDTETEHDFSIAADGTPCIVAIRMAGIVPVSRPG